jgi:two-component system sensor histidine kinase ChvG
MLASSPQEFDLARLAAELVRKRSEHGLGGGTRLLRSLAANVPVRANRELVGEAIDSVLDNALRYSAPESTVAVTLAVGAGIAELRIEDEGPGLDEEKRHRVFHRFLALHQRADGSGDPVAASRGSDLAGLSLWVAKRNLEAAGGTIDLADRSSGGLSVRIALPRLG